MIIYLAGLFDAEGSVSLTPGGNAVISISMCCQENIHLFLEFFGGSVYNRPRESRKDVFTWRCKTSNMKKFIWEIEKYSIVKKEQLFLLSKYLNLSRKERRANRKDFVKQIAACKVPKSIEKKDLDAIQATIIPDDYFFQWFAGFIEGDGSLNCWESKSMPTIKPRFSTSVEACNCNPDTIKYIKERLEGTIGVNKQNKNPVWKWLCSPNNTVSVLARIYPFLIAKQEECKILMEFRTILVSRKRRPIGRKTKNFKAGGWGNPNSLFTEQEATRLREIICRMKFLHNN